MTVGGMGFIPERLLMMMMMIIRGWLLLEPRDESQTVGNFCTSQIANARLLLPVFHFFSDDSGNFKLQLDAPKLYRNF